MNKEEYVKIVNEKLNGIGRDTMLNHIEVYYKSKEYVINNTYNVGDDVNLKKGTLIHGTDGNLNSLRLIAQDGLISSWFITGARTSKYPSSVGVWNLQKDYKLVDYLNYTGGATVKYSRLLEDGIYSNNSKTALIPYDQLDNLKELLKENPCWIWEMQQTKEARFLPSRVQDMVQVAIIFNADNEYTRELIKGDILESNFMNDEVVQPFVHESYYETFIKERLNKDDFFTNRESAIIFGLPSNLIEGVLVGRIYEKDESILDEIKELLPNAYICNIDGKVIRR